MLYFHPAREGRKVGILETNPRVRFAFNVDKEVVVAGKALMSLVSTAFILSIATVCFAGEADVVDVKVNRSGDDTYVFNVTVAHGDTGWEHYADRWEIVSGDGEVIATRVLVHPHVTEQPFTRGLAGVKVPEGAISVIVRAHDSVHEYGGLEVSTDLPR